VANSIKAATTANVTSRSSVPQPQPEREAAADLEDGRDDEHQQVLETITGA